MAFYNEENNIAEDIIKYNKVFWDAVDISAIATEDVLKLALDIKINGYPENIAIRTAILNRFNRNGDGDYYLEYEKLCSYSTPFEEAYPLDMVLYLIKTTITNMQNYLMDINSSSLTSEEKALLYFVLPI